MERERVDEANKILRIQNENLISEGKWNGWSIVIQVHNRLDLLKECFKSIAEARFNIGAQKCAKSAFFCGMCTPKQYA